MCIPLNVINLHIWATFWLIILSFYSYSKAFWIVKWIGVKHYLDQRSICIPSKTPNEQPKIWHGDRYDFESTGVPKRLRLLHPDSVRFAPMISISSWMSSSVDNWFWSFSSIPKVGLYWNKIEAKSTFDFYILDSMTFGIKS